MAFKYLALMLLTLSLPMRVMAQDADLTLGVLPGMIESGFTKHLLPRFGFKTRIKIAPTTSTEEADLAFTTEEGAGKSFFQDVDGNPVYLVVLNEEKSSAEKAEKFASWLESDPGKAAIEGFPKEGPPLYTIGSSKKAEVEEVVLDGDAAAGSKLAIFHCGRCHVVDERNRMGGIGSTPSFAALRGRTGWSDLFLAFFAEAPHPSFTHVIDVTEPFTPERPSHIAPVEITLEDLDAITAFVATMEPKDLGAQVAPN